MIIRELYNNILPSIKDNADVIIRDILDIHKGNFKGEHFRGVGIRNYFGSHKNYRTAIYNQIHDIIDELISIDDDFNINYR